MKFDEWYKEENWGPAFGDNGDFHYGASVVWDYKQAEIDALQKRIDLALSAVWNDKCSHTVIDILKGDKND